MKKLIIANWKSNPDSISQAVKLARASDAKNIVIAPPYPYLEKVGGVLKYASLGSQNVFWETSGPYTGEVSLNQLKNLKVKYVIIGHSERRRLGETDKIVNKKVKATMRAGLKILLCVGEDWNTRRKGISSAKKFVATQIKKDLAGIRNSKFEIRNLAIAYEPIWAIGTGKADKPRQSAEIIKYIKQFLAGYYKLSAIKVLYGGSVNSRNAKSLFLEPEIDGALVGGASLSPSHFQAIVKIRDSL